MIACAGNLSLDTCYYAILCFGLWQSIYLQELKNCFLPKVKETFFMLRNYYPRIRKNCNLWPVLLKNYTYYRSCRKTTDLFLRESILQAFEDCFLLIVLGVFSRLY